MTLDAARRSTPATTRASRSRSSSSSARRCCTTSSTARSRCTARSASPPTRRSSGCTARPATRASTTARTRCTGCRSRGGSCAATCPAGARRSTREGSFPSLLARVVHLHAHGLAGSTEPPAHVQLAPRSAISLPGRQRVLGASRAGDAVALLAELRTLIEQPIELVAPVSARARREPRPPPRGDIAQPDPLGRLEPLDLGVEHLAPPRPVGRASHSRVSSSMTARDCPPHEGLKGSRPPSGSVEHPTNLRGQTLEGG